MAKRWARSSPDAQNWVKSSLGARDRLDPAQMHRSGQVQCSARSNPDAHKWVKSSPGAHKVVKVPPSLTVEGRARFGPETQHWASSKDEADSLVWGQEEKHMSGVGAHQRHISGLDPRQRHISGIGPAQWHLSGLCQGQWHISGMHQCQ